MVQHGVRIKLLGRYQSANSVVWCLCTMWFKDCLFAAMLLAGVVGQKSAPPAPSEDAVDLREDGGYGFRYRNRDQGGHYGEAIATPDNTVSGKFGYREPGTGRNLETVYTAGERGFRAQGPTIHRRMDLGQVRIPYNPPVPQDSPNYNPTYSTYYDPNEDSSYHFDFATNEYKRTENGGPRGQVAGAYSYIDDVGDIHNVEFEAGSQTGYHVKTPYPDSNHNYNELYFRGDGKVPLRGRTSIQRGVDGSYRFTTHSQDQRRSEVKDALGNTRGSYTYIDKDGTQRTVQYIAGPNIGYKIVNQGLGPNIDPQFPFINQNYIPPILLGTGVSGSKKPGYGSGGGPTPPLFGVGGETGIGGGKPSKGTKPRPHPSSSPFLFESSPSSTNKGKPSGSGINGQSSTNSGEGGSAGGDAGGDSPLGGGGGSFGSSTSRPPSSCCPAAGSDKGSGPQFGGSSDDGSPQKGSDSSSDDEPPYSPSGHKPSHGKDPSKKPLSTHGKPNKPSSSTDDFLSPTAGYPPPPHAGFPEEDPNSPKPFRDPSFKPFTIEDNLFLQRPFSSLPPAGPNSKFYPDRVEDIHDKEHSFTSRPEYIDDFQDRDGAYSQEEFRGFPPGISIKGRIQSLDISPFGTKVPTPGEALDHFPTEREERNSS